MKHRIAGRKLGRTSEHRLALLRNLSTALLDKERIKTTLPKAKELRRFAEKLITLSKKETLHARRQVLRHIHDRAVVAKLFDTLSARFAQRPGGYTRVIKLGPRRGDNAEMALIELVDSEAGKAEPTTKKRKAAAGKKPAAEQAAAADAAAEEPAAKPKKKAASRKKTASKAATGKSTRKSTKDSGAKKTSKKSSQRGRGD